jgi:hypothetical protein
MPSTFGQAAVYSLLWFRDVLLGRGVPYSQSSNGNGYSFWDSALRLYEVAEIKPGEYMTLRDVLLPERPPVLAWQNPDGSTESNKRLRPAMNHRQSNCYG